MLFRSSSAKQNRSAASSVSVLRLCSCFIYEVRRAEDEDLTLTRLEMMRESDTLSRQNDGRLDMWQIISTFSGAKVKAVKPAESEPSLTRSDSCSKLNVNFAPVFSVLCFVFFLSRRLVILF